MVFEFSESVVIVPDGVGAEGTGLGSQVVACDDLGKGKILSVHP